MTNPGLTHATPGAHLPKLLRVFAAGSLAALGLMFLIAWFWAHVGVARVGWDPLGDPIFGDLLEYIPTLRLIHTQAFYGGSDAPAVAYPPFTSVLLQVVYATGHAAALYVAVAIVFLALAAWGVRRALLAEGINAWSATLFPISVGLASFPMAGLLQRGNVELFLWIFAVAGIRALLRGHPYRAAVLWGLAASVKLYPVIFFALFLPRRQYRAAAVGVLSFVAVTFASMVYLGPTLHAAWQGSLRGVFGYQGRRVAEWNLHELAENHSFFTWVKTVAVVSRHSVAGLTLPYYACGAIIIALVFFLRLARMPVANQLLGLSVFMVLLPPVSYFYTLVHLYAPWLLLVLLTARSSRAGVHVAGLRTTVLLFLPVFACFTLFTFTRLLLFGGLLQGACLVVLLLCAASFPFADLPASPTLTAGPVEVGLDGLRAIQSPDGSRL